MARKRQQYEWSRDSVRAFFRRSDWLDGTTLRPIRHVAPNWELITGDDDGLLFEEEEDSLAAHLNVLIDQIVAVDPPTDYHAFENHIAGQYDGVINGRYYLKDKLWFNSKTGKPVKKDDVGHMMEQASCGSDDIPELVHSAAGRVATAMAYGKSHFDDLDTGHMEMLAVVMMTILFRRSDWPARAV